MYMKKISTTLKKRFDSGFVPVITDIKCRSPKEGDLMQGRDPVQLAREFACAGASAVSVVTESDNFGGSIELLKQVISAVNVPVLRKDFIKNSYQIEETAGLGASAILLIVSMLEKKQLYKLVEASINYGIEPLIEVHTRDEIELVNSISPTLVGINNRNIISLEKDDGDVSLTEELISNFSGNAVIVSESSISNEQDVIRAVKAGSHAVLVGTAILSADSPSDMLKRLSVKY